MKTEDFRRYLHRHPELANCESGTIAFIAEQLSDLGVEYYTIPNAGLLARVEGRSGNLKRCVVLCADISAEPLTELTGVEWSSQNDGVMHNAGHDFNASVIYGVLKRLHTEPDFEGTLLALFQSGVADNVGGARSVLAEDPFKDYNIAAIIGAEVDDSLEVGEIGFCPGKYMPSMDELQFKVKSANNTSNMRGVAKDSVVAISDLIMRLYTFNSDVCALAVENLTAEGDVNTLPEESCCRCRMWSFDEKLRARVKDMILHAVEEIEYKYDVEIETNLVYGNPCLENDAQLTYEAMLLADSVGFSVKDMEKSCSTSDFGYYAQLYPSLLYMLGVGRSSHRLRTATFLPDERAITVGEEFMYQLALNILNK